jgi:hypothetical protein
MVFAESFLPKFGAMRVPALALLLACAHDVRAQSVEVRREVIAGRVTTATDAPLAGAVIIATMAPNRETFSDTSDADGKYAMRIAHGTGDYLLYIASVGLTPVRKRLVRVGAESVFVFDAQLSAPHAAPLAIVKVAGRRPVPDRNRSSGIEPGASERVPEALNGALATDELGDFNALALTTPGATASAGGYSVLGLGAAQNSATLNGMAFNAGALPRDVRTSARVSTSTYDPSRGWFSGSNVNVELTGGGLFGFARAHATVDAPALQVATPYASAAGQQFTNIRGSYGADGPLTWANEHTYNIGVQAERRTSDVVSLATADGFLLPRLGIAADTSAQLMSALRVNGIPTLTPTLATARVQESASFIGRIERTPNAATTGYQPVATTYGVTLFAQGGRDRGVRLNALSTDSRVGENVNGAAALQGILTHYFNKYFLNETRSSVSVSERRESSMLDAPEGRALVQSNQVDGVAGTTSLAFGGNSYGNRNLRQLTWETTNTSKFFASGRDAHGLRITGDARFDTYRSAIGSNPFGTFTYASLTDVASNTPSSFSRTVVSPSRRGGEWNAFASVGDNWKVTPRFQLLYGLRLEGNAFTTHAAFNPEVLQAFGARTDYAPVTVGVSPRVGFTWLLATPSFSYKAGPSGEFTAPTRRYLRGGVGQFRSMVSPSLLSEAYAANGLPNGTSSIMCIGEATPVPDWQSYEINASTVPTQCVGGARTAFNDASPSVRLVRQGYQPPTSWRGNLVYSTRTAVIDWSAEVIASLNLHQPGTFDLNFAGVEKFRLAGENRPVFVDAASIVPASGVASPVDARGNPSFGRVVSTQSDLRSLSKQLTLSARPVSAYMHNWYLSGSYTLASNRAESRGFDGGAFASPSERTWARGDFDVRHQVITQFGYGKNGMSIAGLLRLQSGTPYTPTIAGDVNGDGLSNNDRAFIANTAGMANGDGTDDLRALLAGNPRAANCLGKQLGRVAGRNSCVNPWSAALNAELSFHQQRLHDFRITSIAINFANPLAGADQILHGSDAMRGWGNATIADATLYTVRGFDPANRAYQYAVNPRFGSPATLSALSRAPFRMTIDISMDLGQPVARQQLNKWLRPGRAGDAGVRLAASDLKKRYESNVPDPFRTVLLQTDSLLLNRAQVEALQNADKPYRAKMDSVWVKLATRLAGLPERFDDAEALRLQEAAVDEGWEVTRLAVHDSLGPIISKLQMSLANGLVQDLYRATVATPRRIYVPQ